MVSIFLHSLGFRYNQVNTFKDMVQSCMLKIDLPQYHSMRLEEWGKDGTELRDLPEKRDGVEFLANGHAEQEAP